MQIVLAAITEALAHLPGLVRRLEHREAQKAAPEKGIEKENRLLRPGEVTRSRLNRALRDITKEFGDFGALLGRCEIIPHCFTPMRLREDRMLDAVTNPAGMLELVEIRSATSVPGARPA